jgi:hypothetical protein
LNRLLNRLYGLSNVINNTSCHTKLLICLHPKFLISRTHSLLAIMATILVVPISRPTVIFSFPLSII